MLSYIKTPNGTYWQAPKAYRIKSYYIFGNHVMNISYVEEKGWVLIEPQSDCASPRHVQAMKSLLY
jgi:hypothetical protein